MLRSGNNGLFFGSKRAGKAIIFLLALLVFVEIMPFKALAEGFTQDPPAQTEEEIKTDAEQLEQLENSEQSEPQPGINALGGLLDEPDTVLCTAPDYCENESCTCSTDPSACVCDDTCPCRIYTQVSCKTPSQCSSDICKCQTDGEAVCICDAACKCQYPDFTSHAEVSFSDGNPATGDVIKASIQMHLSSTEASFADVVIKVFVEDSIKIQPLDLDGRFTYVKTEQESGYNVIYVTIPDSSAAAGMFDVDLMFPPGITKDHTEADIYVEIEGKVNGQPFDKRQNDQDGSEKGTVTASAQETNWTISIENAELDYKNESNDDNIFLQKITLDRMPKGEKGIYYLDENSAGITITLPGDADDSTIKRITTSGGALVSYTDNGDGTITINTSDIPFNDGFTEGYSNAQSAVFNIVFELSEQFMLDNPPESVDDSFYFYDFETEVTFGYITVEKTDSYNDSEVVGIVDYAPTSGTGSIGKGAEPSVKGKTFFDDQASTMTPIKYSISFMNRTNSPMKDLILKDERPELRWINGNVSEVIPDLENVPKDSVFFYSFTLTENTTSSPLYLRLFKNNIQQGSDIPLTLDTKQTINQKDIDEIQIVTDNGVIVEHGETIKGVVEVIGDVALASDQTTRDKIKFVRNTISFIGKSTKDISKTLSGSHSAQVYVYPYANTPDPAKIWDLSGQISAATSGFQPSVEITRGKNVYYRLEVKPRNAEQIVFDSVFFIELPIEVQWGDTPDVALSGAIEAAGYTVSVVNNPMNANTLLMVKPNAGAGQLLDPSKTGYITVKGMVDANTPQGVTVKTKVYFGVLDTNTPLEFSPNPMPAYATVADSATKAALSDIVGTATEFWQSNIQLKVRGSGFLEGELSVQTEFDRETDAWHRHPEVSYALAGGQLYYKFHVRNSGQLDAENIELYNIFSTEGDSFIVGGAGRGSNWKPYLTGPVQLPPELVGNATVYYSEFADHRVNMSGGYSGTKDWTETPYNWSAIKAIKIVCDPSYKLPKEGFFDIIVPMLAPTDFEIKPDPEKNSAVSSLATKFNFEGKNPMAWEPLRVVVEMVDTDKSTISGVIWDDQNKDGVKDSVNPIAPALPVEFGKEDVEVMLFMYNGSTYEYRYSTKTDNEGKYRFTNVDNGTYEVRVVLPDGYNPGGMGPDNKYETSIQTDTHPLTEDSYRYIDYDGIFSIITKEDFSDQDGAIYSAPGTISGTVWRSFDKNSPMRDISDLAKDKGLEDVIVTLYKVISGDEREKIQTTTTASGGAYAFTNVPAGRYVVICTPLTDYSIVKRTETVYTQGSPVLPNESQASPSKSGGYALGQSFEIWLSAGGTQTGIDCGLVPKAGSISGNIWSDTDGSMNQGAGKRAYRASFYP